MVGNVVRAVNPEATAMRERALAALHGLPADEAQALGERGDSDAQTVRAAGIPIEPPMRRNGLLPSALFR